VESDELIAPIALSAELWWESDSGLCQQLPSLEFVTCAVSKFIRDAALGRPLGVDIQFFHFWATFPSSLIALRTRL
jgi:hypothetical protein